MYIIILTSYSQASKFHTGKKYRIHITWNFEDYILFKGFLKIGRKNNDTEDDILYDELISGTSTWIRETIFKFDNPIFELLNMTLRLKPSGG